MAHIPESARYVAPPSEREVDEDAVTEEAVDILYEFGGCRSCRVDGDNMDDGAWAVWADAHAQTCAKLRAKAEDRLYGEAE